MKTWLPKNITFICRKIAFHILFMFTATLLGKREPQERSRVKYNSFISFPLNSNYTEWFVCFPIDGGKDNCSTPNQFRNERQASVCFTNLSASFLVAQPSFLRGPLQLPFCTAWWYTHKKWAYWFLWLPFLAKWSFSISAFQVTLFA